MDLFKRWTPNASAWQLVGVGQVAVAVLVVAAPACLSVVARASKLFEYLRAAQAYIAPPIEAVFRVELLWRRANGAGAMATPLTGFVLGALRFVCELHGCPVAYLVERDGG